MAAIPHAICEQPTGLCLDRPPAVRMARYDVTLQQGSTDLETFTERHEYYGGNQRGLPHEDAGTPVLWPPERHRVRRRTLRLPRSGTGRRRSLGSRLC